VILRLTVSKDKYDVRCVRSVSSFVCENILFRELENKMCVRLSKVIRNLHKEQGILNDAIV
jgi:hypothetical protein